MRTALNDDHNVIITLILRAHHFVIITITITGPYALCGTCMLHQFRSPLLFKSQRPRLGEVAKSTLRTTCSEHAPRSTRVGQKPQMSKTIGAFAIFA